MNVAVNTSVLLVDDSLTVRMDLTEALEAAQLTVVACTTVAEANAALAEKRFGLIILDVILPDGDGVDLLEQIRETPSLNGVAVILLSDEAAVRDRIRGLITGADEYIGKPYDADYVVACAQGLLRDAGETSQDAILVIDDSITFCEQMREALEGAKYRVLIANSGEAGLRMAASSRPAAIIVDRTLPGIDGVGVLRGIRLDAALRHMPCILLTASEEKNDEVAALDAGADAFVRKDEDIAIILARLGVVLRNAEDGRAGERIKASLQGPKRILVVDGNEKFLQKVTADLRAEGYEVIQARSGEEAFDLLSAQAVDCILFDLDMPDIASDEACRRIKSFSFSSSMPIIMMVTRDDRDAIIRCLAAGADDYINKSGAAAVLRSRVLAQIRRKQSEDENRLIRRQLANRQAEIADADAARKASEMHARAMEQCRAKIAFQELRIALAQEERWSAMGLCASQLAQDIAPLLSNIDRCLSHARRAQRDASQAGHLAELLEQASDETARVLAVVPKHQAAVASRAATRGSADLNGIVEHILSLVIGGGWANPGEIKMRLAPALPPVSANTIQIQQILLNLFRNGLDAMRDVDRKELVVTTAVGDPGMVRVTVADNGRGGAENLFATTAPERLDLRICRHIVEDHGGKIRSAPNGAAGTIIMLELPVAG